MGWENFIFMVNSGIFGNRVKVFWIVIGVSVLDVWDVFVVFIFSREVWVMYFCNEWYIIVNVIYGKFKVRCNFFFCKLIVLVWFLI